MSCLATAFRAVESIIVPQVHFCPAFGTRQILINIERFFFALSADKHFIYLINGAVRLALVVDFDFLGL